MTCATLTLEIASVENTLLENSVINVKMVATMSRKVVHFVNAIH